jgi:diaminopimelate epimerase
MTPFYKMHGLGNDFVVMNALTETIPLEKDAIARWAHRRLGIGFDQLLVIEPSSQADFFCRIFNSDGTEAEQCGNGLRCVARLLHEEGWHPQSMLHIQTKAGIFPIFIQNYDAITVTMGTPEIQHSLMDLALATESLSITQLLLGNPHVIVRMDSLTNKKIPHFGAEISTHPLFTQGANVGFMEIVNRQHIRLRTFERGAGFTLACGSNACAAVVAGMLQDWLETKVTVTFEQGSLEIEWQNKTGPVIQTGPASRVFSGELITGG